MHHQDEVNGCSLKAHFWEREEAQRVSFSRFGVSNPGSNLVGRAFARVEGDPAGGNPGA